MQNMEFSMSNPFESPQTGAASSANRTSGRQRNWWSWVWLPMMFASIHTLVFVWWAGLDGKGVEGWGGFLWGYFDFPISDLYLYERPSPFFGGLLLGGLQWLTWGLLLTSAIKFLKHVGSKNSNDMDDLWESMTIRSFPRWRRRTS